MGCPLAAASKLPSGCSRAGCVASLCQSDVQPICLLCPPPFSVQAASQLHSLNAACTEKPAHHQSVGSPSRCRLRSWRPPGLLVQQQQCCNCHMPSQAMTKKFSISELHRC